MTPPRVNNAFLFGKVRYFINKLIFATNSLPSTAGVDKLHRPAEVGTYRLYFQRILSFSLFLSKMRASYEFIAWLTTAVIILVGLNHTALRGLFMGHPHTLINGFCCESETECDFNEDLVNITGCCRNGGPINITQWRTDQDAYLTCGFPLRMRQQRRDTDWLSARYSGCLASLSIRGGYYASEQEVYLKCGFPPHMTVPRFSMYPDCLESGEGPKDIHLWPSDEEAYRTCGFPRHMHARRMPIGDSECLPLVENGITHYLANGGGGGPKDLQGWSSDADAYIICGFPPHMREKRDVPRRVFCESC